MIKIRSFNGSEHTPEECGSFTIVSRKLNQEFKKRGIYSEDNDAFVIVPECLNTKQQFKNQIPLLASEYSLPPHFVIQWLIEYNPIVFAISQFAKDNLVRGGYPENKIFITHLASDSSEWYEDGGKSKIFSYLTVNSSNDRSGFEELIPAFLEFSEDKYCILIIKDGKNDKFKNWIESFKSDKLIYDDRRLNNKELRRLYSHATIHLYYNHTTSFGMTGLDAALCGTPSLITLGSAPKEFYPEWTQPIKVKTDIKPLEQNILDVWNNCGLNCPPLHLYPFGTMREAVNKKDILKSLEYSWSNYLELININERHQEYIKKELTWEKTCDRIVEVLINN